TSDRRKRFCRSNPLHHFQGPVPTQKAFLWERTDGRRFFSSEEEKTAAEKFLRLLVPIPAGPGGPNPGRRSSAHRLKFSAGRLFGHSGACSACGQSIPASEMVMRAQGSVYHLKCFTCATCRNRLVPGDRFHYINGTIFCEHDRPGGGLLSGHSAPLQPNGIMSDQKVC
uniref:LIM domain only 4a n=1 Tax=Fundulus heteroclitus TaxID=8078 RepID=A0A3Q2NVF1_FUNHE